MTKPAILETLAARMWKAQAENSGAPASVSLGRTPELFATQSEETRSSFLRYAAAVLEMVGPKPLHWMNNGNHWAGGLGWVVRKMGGQYVLTKASRFDQYFPTLESAQSAAQAHADAAHWGNTPIGKLLKEDNANG